MNINPSITFSDTGCVHSEGCSLNTTIVEGPIERHKSRPASRETGDRLTGTYFGGGSFDRTETMQKMAAQAPCACRPEGSLSTG